ncbi:MAG: DUF1611 domain-containing protein [Alphaproteobacteria bacterium]|jgi:hypothetical protein|nr:DUF1611 domain-containing protein [Alphaproteobacteria bacterium]
MVTTRINADRLAALKPSFATRRVDRNDIGSLDREASDLKPGDLVVARVTEVGHHANIERPNGRRSKLFSGDEILVACGARYAPDQFEAEAPVAVGPAELVAAGGIVGHVGCAHDRMKPATQVTILGAACRRDGRRLTLADYALRTPPAPVTVPVVAVCGTAMNAGKTHTAASLVRGLAVSGVRVAAIKVTGTGAGGDLWSFHDAGAAFVGDFTDAGFATTYRQPVPDILEGARRLITEAEAAGCAAIVLEVADGLCQAETAALLQADGFREMLSGVIFAAGDAMGAEAGVAWLRRAGHRVLAVAGRLTCAPLAVREAEAAIGIPCLTPADFLSRDPLARLLPSFCMTPVPEPGWIAA